MDDPHSFSKFYDLQVVGVGEEDELVVVAELYALDLPRATSVVSDSCLPHSQGKGFQAVEDHIVFYANSQDVVVSDLRGKAGTLQLAYAQARDLGLELPRYADSVAGDPKLDLFAGGDPVDFLVCADSLLNFILLGIDEFCYFGWICVALRKQRREYTLLLGVLPPRCL